MSRRLYIFVEGFTEEKFCTDVLYQHLCRFGVFLFPMQVSNCKTYNPHRSHKGGILSFVKVERDMKMLLTQQHTGEIRFSTMFDLYALPDNFPGMLSASAICDKYDRVAVLEKALSSHFNDSRLIPYLQLHEFEALLFADTASFQTYYPDFRHCDRFDRILQNHSNNPELINDGDTTAPSKCILREIPDYDKANAGIIIAKKIGLPVLRAKCRHFNEWLTELEKLGRQPEKLS